MYNDLPFRGFSTGSGLHDKDADGVRLALDGRQGYAWAEDKEHCEEQGRLLQADITKVSQRAKKRGLPQVRPLIQPVCTSHTSRNC